ncbi:TerC family protein [Bacillus shivajii]|uniref:TerC family protein n=1 Tax=Bacillus shivajii TaxID=1983719 RepID=UPI001CFAE633|nr:TerC family protein [Bacillus shivajii]UCZ51954.1 TerC family protein [Bacillus shivajii]
MSSEFLTQLLMVIGIDIILGGDNAIVVALACRNLPPHLRNKAIVLGILLAIAARGVLTLVAVELLAIPYLMSIGGILLLWIAYRLLVSAEEEHSISSKPRVRDAIKTIVVADIVMGFDNVLAIAGVAQGNGLIALIGLVISVPIIIWGSKIILFLMKKFPFIIYIGSAILVYTAAKMILHEQVIQEWIHSLGLSNGMFIYLLIAFILFIGWAINHIKGIEFFHTLRFSRNKKQ